MGSRVFWRELKRRHVYRVAAAYVVVGWLLIQAVTQIFPVFHLPDWIEQTVVLVILVGFPIALVLAWAFDSTSAGSVKTDAVTEDTAGPMPPRHSRRAGAMVGLIGVVLAAIAGVAWWQLRAPRVRPPPASSAHVAALRGSAGSSHPPGNAAPGSARTPSAGSATATVASGLPAQPIPAKSVAVLPFENLSTDKANAYFADGMQDLILTKLADIGDLKVISRTSTMKYASHPDDLKTIGRQLGVATILEGSVQKAGNQVLINVQLIDAKTDGHIWAQSYQRNLTNIFGVEGEVAQKVATALNAKLSPLQSKTVNNVSTRNPQAYDAYLRAQHYADEDTEDLASPKAIAGYKQAVALDPKFALAWADLAWTQYWAYREDQEPATLRTAEENAKRALALAPDLPEAHVAMSVIDLYGLGDIKAAQVQAQRALQLRPNYAYAYRLLADTHQAAGDFVTGAKLMDHALALKPNDAVLAVLVGMAHEFIGDYAGARQALQRALAINPNTIDAYYWLSEAKLLESGDIAAALDILDSIPASVPNRQNLDGQRVDLLVMQGDYAAARKVVSAMPHKSEAGKITVADLRADIEYAAGGTAKARPYLLTLEALLRHEHGSPTIRIQFALHEHMALVLARLGRKEDALRQMDTAMGLGQRAHGLADVAGLYTLAMVQATLGERTAAIATLQKLMSTSGHQAFLSPATLKVDPVWNPVRKDPRFRALLKKYAQDQPAVGRTPSAATAHTPQPAAGSARPTGNDRDGAAAPAAAATSGSGHD